MGMSATLDCGLPDRPGVRYSAMCIRWRWVLVGVFGLAATLKEAGFPMPSIGDSMQPFVDLWQDPRSLASWENRVSFGMSLCE